MCMSMAIFIRLRSCDGHVTCEHNATCSEVLPGHQLSWMSDWVSDWVYFWGILGAYFPQVPSQKLRFPGHQMSWVIDSLIDHAQISRVSDWLSMQFISIGSLSNGDHKRDEIWCKGSLGDEDDAWMSNTRIEQRKHVISTMKNNNHNIIQCCNKLITLTRAPWQANLRLCFVPRWWPVNISC